MTQTLTERAEFPAHGRLAGRYLVILIAALSLLSAVLEVSVRLALPKVSRTKGRIDAECRASLVLRRGGAHKSVFVIGNSLLLTDVDIPKLQRALAPDFELSRYAVEQTNYLDWYYGLRLWYSQGASADVVLLCLNSRQTISDAVRGDYFAYTMMRTEDFWRASRDSKLSPTNTFSLLLASVSAFYGTRTETRKVLLSRLVPGVSDVARLVAPSPETAPLDAATAADAAARRLSRIKDLVSRHGGRLILLAPATRDAEDLRILQEGGSPAVVTVVEPLAAFSLLPSDFRDGFHLNDVGEAKYTDALIPQLREALAAPDPWARQRAPAMAKPCGGRTLARIVSDSTYGQRQWTRKN